MVASPTISLATSLGFLPGGTQSQAVACSADGSVIVGFADDASANIQAVMWKRGIGPTILGTLPGGTAAGAAAVSDDGTIIVGAADSTNGTRGFYWTAGTGMVDLGSLPVLLNGTVNATVISGDGSRIAGVGTESFVAGSKQHLVTFDMPAGPLVDRGFPPSNPTVDHLGGQPYAMSHDGSIIGGGIALAEGTPSNSIAWAWTSGGFVSLPDPPLCQGSVILCMSDNSAILGGCSGVIGGSPTTYQGWLLSNGIYNLYDPFDSNITTGLSSDGQSYVGYTTQFPSSGPDTAFFTTSNYGGFSEFGLPPLGAFPDNSSRALALSKDGLTIVGFSGASGYTGTPTAAFWTVIPPPPPVKRLPQVYDIGLWQPTAVAEGVR